MPHGSDEIIFIGIILGIAIVVLVLLLAAVAVLYVSERRRNDKLTFRSLAGTVTDFFPGTGSKEAIAPASPDESDKESLLPAPAPEADTVAAIQTESTLGSSINNATDSTLVQSRDPVAGESWSARQIVGIALTGALMLAPVLEVPQIIMGGDSSLFRALPLLPFWAAAVGAIGFRAAKLSWRQTVLSAVLVGVALLLNARLQEMLSNEPFLLLGSARGVIWVSGGLFLLPLFDPAVRKAGLSPSRWKIVLTALALALLYVFVFIRAGSDEIWVNLFRVVLLPRIPFVPSGILLVLGLVVALFSPRAITSAWLGGVGILCSLFMYVGPLFILVLFPPI